MKMQFMRMPRLKVPHDTPPLRGFGSLVSRVLELRVSRPSNLVFHKPGFRSILGRFSPNGPLFCPTFRPIPSVIHTAYSVHFMRLPLLIYHLSHHPRHFCLLHRRRSLCPSHLQPDLEQGPGYHQTPEISILQLPRCLTQFTPILRVDCDPTSTRGLNESKLRKQGKLRKKEN
jgi:hypothetical protein